MWYRSVATTTTSKSMLTTRTLPYKAQASQPLLLGRTRGARAGEGDVMQTVSHPSVLDDRARHLFYRLIMVGVALNNNSSTHFHPNL